MNKIIKIAAIKRFLIYGASLAVLSGTLCTAGANAQCFPQYAHEVNRKVYRANKISFDGLADLTGDGKADAYGTELQSNNTFRNIVILPNTGSGTFGEPVIINTTLPVNTANGVYQKVRYGAIVAGDLNGDGKQDFVIRAASSPQAFFTLLSAKGDSYTQSNPTVVANDEFVVSTADINGDGRGDIVTNIVPRFENTGGWGSVSYRLGNTDGTFGAPVLLSGGSIESLSPVVGDFNNDGKIDVAINYYGNPNGYHLKTLMNLGGGLFSDDPAQLQVGMEISGTADVNNDGKLDIWGDGVLINNGTGFFTPHAIPPPLPPTPDTYPLLNSLGRNLLMDFDGDGDKDIVVAYEAERGGAFQGPGGLIRKYQQVYINDGSFNFTRTDIARPLVGAPLEMTGDSKDDLVIFVNSTNGLPRFSGSNEAALIVREDLCSPVVQGQNELIDFAGDGVSDLAAWRSGEGKWRYVSNVVENSFTWGGGSFGDVPAPGDYDGDGKTDAAVFRNSTGDWWILRSSDGAFTWTHFGAADDLPVPADYNGDGKTDIAVFRPSLGDWYIDYSDNPNYTFLHFGANGDIPVPADFDGDGADNICIYRPSGSDWFYLTPAFDNFVGLHWGTTGDQPIPADFDMDGKADVAVFRPADGNWYVFRSFDQGFDFFHFGQAGDLPMMVDSNGDGVLEIGATRQVNPGGGYLWLVSNQPLATWASFGLVSERPLRVRLAND
jgi:FG-GAP-like repeat